MCYLRRKFAEKFAGRIKIGDIGTFYFDNISAEDVSLFLLKRTYRMFFVWLAVPSKPSSQTIWLKA